jgi:hypothetical protein
MVFEAGEDISVRVRFEREVTGQPGRNGRWRDPSLLFFRSAQAR